MELYDTVAYELSHIVTKRYSTSFSMSSRLFHASIRPHIYAIYGMVRIADEIVDNYMGEDAAQQLDAFEKAVHDACLVSYSTNPIIHSFAKTARQFDITNELLAPFFESMRVDLSAKTFTEKAYRSYIYGSAEVIGLMCLKVFVAGDNSDYNAQKHAAQALGAAYQKINFLRDMKADYEALGRVYFPGVTFASFDEDDKKAIITDIEHDMAAAKAGLPALPRSARKAVTTSYTYYGLLLAKLKRTPAETIKTQRIRIPNIQKVLFLTKARLHL